MRNTNQISMEPNEYRNGRPVTVIHVRRGEKHIGYIVYVPDIDKRKCRWRAFLRMSTHDTPSMRFTEIANRRSMDAAFRAIDKEWSLQNKVSRMIPNTWQESTTIGHSRPDFV